MSAWRQSMAAAALLIVATGLLTWPLAREAGSALPDLGDPLLNSWILAWDLHALRHAPLRLFDANMFYPHRGTLAYTESLLGLVPVAAPWALLGAGPVVTHNLVLLATFPLTGLAMFWLVRALTGSAGAAVVAGLLYAFSHYRFAQLGHVQLLSHEWLPLALLGLHRVTTRGARWRDLALSAGAVAAQALSSGYYAYFAAASVGVFGLWLAAPAARPPLGRLLRRGAVTAAVTASALFPFFLPYALARRDVTLVRPLDEVYYYSARPSSYLAAAPDNRWLGNLTAPLRRPEGALFPGVVTLILAAVGAVTALRSPARATADPDPPAPAWRRRVDLALAALLLITLGNALVLGGFVVHVGPLRITQRHVGAPLAGLAAALLVRRLLHGRAVPLTGLGWLRRLGWPRAAGLYVLLTLAGVLCSLGPTLWVLDRPAAEPLYRSLYEVVPGFDGLRAPARFAVVAETGLAVLAGYGVAAIAGRLRRATVRVAGVAALGALAAVEAWAVPVTLDPAPTGPGPVDRWLAAAPGRGAVVTLPMYRKPDAHLEARRLVGSVAHWRPLVNGYAGFFPHGYWDLVDTLNAFPADAAVTRLRRLGVRYVVLYLGQFPAPARQRLEAALQALPSGLEPVAALENAAIVELRPPP